MSYKHLMVPFDGSDLSRAALSLGAWIAWRSGAELDLVQAVPRDSPGEVSNEAHKLWDEGIRATTAALPGEPGSVLLDYMKQARPDLVVMGTHARILPQRWLLGSIASLVVRSSTAPVILVPREAAIRRDDTVRILVALDGSNASEAALDAALDLAENVPAELTLFQVLDSASPSVEGRDLDWYNTPVLGHSYLEDVQQRLTAKHLHCRRAYSAGDPADEIVHYAELGGFDLVALATHARTGMDRLIMGSVAEHVTRAAQVPVLLSPLPQPAEAKMTPDSQPIQA